MMLTISKAKMRHLITVKYNTHNIYNKNSFNYTSQIGIRNPHKEKAINELRFFLFFSTLEFFFLLIFFHPWSAVIELTEIK